VLLRLLIVNKELVNISSVNTYLCTVAPVDIVFVRTLAEIFMLIIFFLQGEYK
jgi:hypothetical protein